MQYSDHLGFFTIVKQQAFHTFEQGGYSTASSKDVSSRNLVQEARANLLRPRIAAPYLKNKNLEQCISQRKFKSPDKRLRKWCTCKGGES